jgi:SAM-dependent methyltransferase
MTNASDHDRGESREADAMNVGATRLPPALFYACPTCRSPLVEDDERLRCLACDSVFSVVDDIPEFIAGDLSASPDPQLRRMRFIDRMANLYESQLWYPVVMKVYGGLRAPLLPRLIRSVSDILHPVHGRILDVACGPGTFGRRIASPTKEVWGIDVSRGMLRQGAAYAEAERIANLQFARARVEALAFGDACFDGVICCGSLHLFADTRAALQEIARVMKPEAVLASFTFTVGDGGLLKYEGFRRWSRDRHGLHVFELDELNRPLRSAGFEDFRPEVAVVTFSARKRVRDRAE